LCTQTFVKRLYAGDIECLPMPPHTSMSRNRGQMFGSLILTIVFSFRCLSATSAASPQPLCVNVPVEISGICTIVDSNHRSPGYLTTCDSHDMSQSCLCWIICKREQLYCATAVHGITHPMQLQHSDSSLHETWHTRRTETLCDFEGRVAEKMCV
jgi:hypothetical protein